jgi:4-hydroxy-2-oxoheptanedioate aldolase
MQPNPVKAALRAGHPQLGTWITLGNLFATRLLARLGFQWITVDLEHCPIDWQLASDLFGAIADAGCVSLARLPDGQPQTIKRALDLGCHGIIVPMVETVEEASRIVAATKYPPLGNRSIGGSMQAINFRTTTADYFASADREVLVVLQIESPTGVKNASEIGGLSGVDALFVGPNDLLVRMRQADGSDPSPANFEAALNTVLVAGKEANVPVGIYVGNAQAAQDRLAMGWQMIGIGSDLSFMLQGATSLAEQLGLDGLRDMARF